MELVKLGKKGQVTIPRAVLRSVGVTDEGPLLVDTTSDGAIVLRPAVVYPVEIYSDERIAEFDHSNDVSVEVLDKVRERIDGRQK